jgi:DNA replication protein DnaC
MPAVLSTSPINGEKCTAHRETLPCPVCEVLAADAKKAKELKSLAGIRDIQIGRRYHSMTFDDYKPATEKAAEILAGCIRYANTFQQRLEGCDSLLMLGRPGTGKNMLAACICKEVVGQGHTALHTTAMRLVRKIKTSWGKDSEKDEQAMIDQFAKPDLLVVDEVGVQFGSVTEKILLFEAINGRYENMRPTILISNLSLDDVEKFMGVTLVDRFHEGKSAVMVFDWDSYRRRQV